MKAGEHSCFVYEDDRDWLPGVTAFISSGLDSGGRVVYVNEEHTEPELTVLLASGGVDIVPHRKNNCFQVISFREFYMREGVFDMEATLSALENEMEKTRRDGWPALWITGEMGWALGDEGNLKMLERYESSANRMFSGGFPVSAMCQYNLSRFGNRTMLGVLKTHPKVVWNGQVMHNCFFIPNVDTGENDN